MVDGRLRTAEQAGPSGSACDRETVNTFTSRRTSAARAAPARGGSAYARELRLVLDTASPAPSAIPRTARSRRCSTAAWITASTRWLRGMKAGLTARIAACRSAGDCGSSAMRWRQRAAHSSKAAGSVNSRLHRCHRRHRSAASPRRRKVSVKSASFLRHRVEQVLHQRLVAVARGEQADLAAQPGLIGGGEFFREFAEDHLRLFDRLVLVVGEQRQQAFGQPRQIPQRDPRLVGIGVAALFVDRGEHGGRDCSRP